MNIYNALSISGYHRQSILLFLLSLSLLFICCKNKLPDEHADISYVDARIEKRASVADTFCVAFYNLENCFDLEYDGTEYPEYVPGLSSWTREVQLVKINSMAQVIAALDADIVGLCEIEDEDAVDDLIEGLKRFNRIYRYRAVGMGEVRSITCPALLSRFPIKQIQMHHIDLEGRNKTREIIEADVEIGDRILKIFVNHWPSKLNPESFRLKAAEVLASRLKALPPSTEYILMGDFNADYNEFQTFSSFKLNNSNGITGLNNLLKTVVVNNTATYYVKQNTIRDAGAGAHYDLWLELPEQKRMSYVFRGNNQTPDHILIPATLLDHSGLSYLDNSFSSFTWESKLLKNGKPYRWQIKWVKKHKLHLGLGYSDHLPVYAKFTNMPFQLDTSSNQSIVSAVGNVPNKSAGGFEESMDGWISCTNEATVERDSSIAFKGRWSLKISGPAMKTNKTVAKTTFKVIGTTCDLNLRGSGKFSFRIGGGDTPWTYYNSPDFRSSKSARYKDTNIDHWSHLEMQLTTPLTNVVELEVRAGKEAPFVLWIDNVN